MNSLFKPLIKEWKSRARCLRATAAVTITEEAVQKAQAAVWTQAAAELKGLENSLVYTARQHAEDLP